MTCGVCLKDDVEVLNIFGEEGTSLEMSSIIKQHFWFEPIEDDPILCKICGPCWENVASFHVFYTEIKEAHQKLSHNYYSNQQYTGNGFYAHKLLNEDPIDAHNDVLSHDNPKNLAEHLPEVTLMPLSLGSKTIHTNCTADVRGDENLPDGTHLYFKQEQEGVLDQNVFSSQTKNDSFDGQAYYSDMFEYTDDHKTEMSVRGPKEYPSAYCEDITSTQQYQPFYRHWPRQPQSRKRNISETIHSSTSYQSKESERITTDRSSLNYKRDPKNKLSTRDQAKTKSEDELIAKYIKLDCELCDSKFEKFYEIARHYQVAHNISGYARCCGRKLPSRAYVLDHINKHINPDNYRCKECNKTFSSQYAIKNHLAMKHSPEVEKTIQCKDFTKKISIERCLDQHTTERVAEDDKQLYCIECHKSFPSVTAIQMHRNLFHRKLIGHICHVCGRIIRGKALFVKHVNDHAISMGQDAINDPVCPICGKISASVKTLRHHLRYVHSSDRPHKCTVCGKGFKIRQKLKEHMGTHAVGMSIPCPYCPKRFRSKIHVYSHKYRMHKKEYEIEKLNRFQNHEGTGDPGFEIPYDNSSMLYESHEQPIYDDSIVLIENSSPDDCYVVS